jgi:hypothetical protein
VHPGFSSSFRAAAKRRLHTEVGKKSQDTMAPLTCMAGIESVSVNREPR